MSGRGRRGLTQGGAQLLSDIEWRMYYLENKCKFPTTKGELQRSE